jgi:predicted MFS family arabinose efflux permease
MLITGAAASARRLLPEAGPARILAIATLVDTLGRGLFMSVSAIFFTRSVGLSVAEVGLGLGIAAGAGLLTSTPLGYLADRYGPREVLLGSALAQAAITAALLSVHEFWGFLVLVVLGTAVARGGGAARGALVAGLFGAERRVRVQAYQRAITNVGISTGTVFAGLALAVDTRTAYVALILGDATTYLVMAAMLLRLPRVHGTPAPTSGPRIVALRDKPFLVYAVLHGILAMHYGLFTIAMPLWVTTRTSAPPWIVAVLFLVNGLSCVLLQVRVSRGSDGIDGAARAHVRSGLLVAAACLVYAATAGRAPWLAVSLLLLAAGLHVLGELHEAAGGWGLAFGLARPGAQGQYQGAFSMGFGMADMAGPVVLTFLAVQWGPPGWLLLAAMFAATGAAVPAVARWAQRTRTT